MPSLVQLPFRGTALHVASDHKMQLVSLRHACQAIGLEFSAQLQKLRKRNWARVSMIDTRDSAGRRSRLAMIDRRTFTMWLATIDTNRVNPSSKEVLQAFQLEAANVLDAYFNGGGILPPVNDVGIQISEPLATLPLKALQDRYQPAPHWKAVAALVAETPGMWRAVNIESLSPKRHIAAAKEIRNGTLAAFRNPPYDAAIVNGELYIRTRPNAEVAA